MIDTHCHLTEPVFRDRIDEVLAGIRAAGISDIVVPSVDLAGSVDALALSAGRPPIHVAAGIHPMWADFQDESGCMRAVDELAAFIAANRHSIVAVGEIGLDDDHGPGFNPVNLESRALCFRLQLGLARDFGLPVIIHSRGQTAELVATLESFGTSRAGGVMHAFSGSVETMAVLRRLGYLRGVAGTVTRPAAVRLAATIRATPVADMVLETDAPFIANAWHRRGETVPGDLAGTAAALAALTGTGLSALIRITDDNARRIFGF